ncbi:MAG: PAS domain-containing protein [Candidatus Brocadiales bacterium]|nr:PAS domain-containing protein [Candidatus Brocadiales bacterium]
MLRKSIARLNKAQRIAEIGSWELDLITNTLYWSDEVYRIFDLEPQQFVATYEAFLDNIHPDDREFVNIAYTESVKNKTPYDIVHRLLLKDGTIKFVNERCETFHDDTGKAVCSIGTVQDITERIQAESQILRQTVLLEAINNVLQEALTCETEEELGKTCLSIAENLTSSKFGFIGELNTEGFFDTIAISNPGWDACEMAVTDARKYIKSMPARGIDRSTIRDGESRIVNEDEMATHPDRVGPPEGHPKLTSFLGVPLKHEGKIIGMIGLGNKEGGYEIADQEAVENLTVAIVEVLKNKRVEDALENREVKFRTLFEESRDPIYITSQDGEIIDHNEAWCDLFGYTREEFKQIKAVNLFCDVADRKRFQTAMVETGHVKDLEIRYRKKDGTEMICLETAAVLRDEKTNIIGYQGTIRDMTEKIEVRKQLEKALEEAQKADRIKTLFLANMSHEIRTPLTSIVGYSDLIENSVIDKVGPEERLFFDIIRNSNKRLLQTIHSVLDISKIEAMSFKLTPEPFNLIETTDQAISSFHSQATETNLDLTFSFEVDNPIINADKYCIQQSICNLLDNAIKYTEEGFIAVKINEQDGQLILTIEDTGIGIADDYQGKLFEAFSQESMGYTKKYQGVGLGLTLTKRYLDLNEIPIELESKKGVGTKFTITFTSIKKPEKEIKKIEPSVQESLETERKAKVLIVEDDINAQNLLKFFLRDLCDTFFAVSVAEAKSSLKEHNVDLVLLDLSLIGNEDGLDLARFMRESKQWKTLPIVAVTAHAFTSDRDNVLEAGCDDYIAKPIKRDDLLKMIKRYFK